MSLAAAAAVTLLDAVSKFNDLKTHWIGVLLGSHQGSDSGEIKSLITCLLAFQTFFVSIFSLCFPPWFFI